MAYVKKSLLVALFVGIALFVGPIHDKTHAQGNIDITGFTLFAQFCSVGQSCTIVGTMAPGIGVVKVLGGDAGNFITTMQVVQLTGICPNVTPDGQIVGACPFVASAPAIPGVRWAGYMVVNGNVDVTATYCFDPTGGAISEFNSKLVRFH